MSVFVREMRDVLRPAVEAARDALGDLEPDEIPRQLRRVAATSGGRLPPPLVKSVLEALDREEWLRDKALEKLDERHAGTAAAAFLERGGAWWNTVADEVAARRATSTAATSAASEAQVDELAAKLDVAKKRLKQAGAELDAEKVRARRLADGERPSKQDAGEAKKLKAKLKKVEATLEEVVDDRVEAEAMIARLRSRLKRSLKEQRKQRSAGEGASELGTDPIALAKNLDLMAAAAPNRHAAASDPEATERVIEAIELPRGTRPDAKEAVAWLTGLSEQFAVIVDGYNVLYGFDPATFTTAASRRFLADQLARIRRANSKARVVVVYDSNLPGDREAQVLDWGVELHFSADDEIADDKIVELAAASSLPVVVITSDRDLRQRSEAEGALTLWSEALVEWMSPD